MDVFINLSRGGGRIQIIMLYTLTNLRVCQLYLKAEEKKKRTKINTKNNNKDINWAIAEIKNTIIKHYEYLLLTVLFKNLKEDKVLEKNRIYRNFN